MDSSLVLTVIGLDRPGLVEELSQTITRHGASWQQSRMAHLAGRFAGILELTVSPARVEELTEALVALEAKGLRVVVERSGDPSGSPDERELRLSLVGQDRPGIVSEISRAIASRGVNVVELVTSVSSAPMSGETLFHVDASLFVPATVSVDELRDALEEIASDLMVEVTLGEAD